MQVGTEENKKCIDFQFNYPMNDPQFDIPEIRNRKLGQVNTIINK